MQTGPFKISKKSKQSQVLKIPIENCAESHSLTLKSGLNWETITICKWMYTLIPLSIAFQWSFYATKLTREEMWPLLSNQKGNWSVVFKVLFLCIENKWKDFRMFSTHSTLLWIWKVSPSFFVQCSSYFRLQASTLWMCESIVSFCHRIEQIVWLWKDVADVPMYRSMTAANWKDTVPLYKKMVACIPFLSVSVH